MITDPLAPAQQDGKHGATATIGSSPSETKNLFADLELLGDEAICGSCEHSRGVHDRIAERYCQATQDNALSRGCICPKTDGPATKTYGKLT
jgi:hypothetical protein